jgi:hypothetical protein
MRGGNDVALPRKYIIVAALMPYFFASQNTQLAPFLLGILGKTASFCNSPNLSKNIQQLHK